LLLHPFLTVCAITLASTMAAQNLKLAAALVMLSGLASASQVEVVLSHHSEDLAWLSTIPEDVSIRLYTKGPKAQPDMPRAAAVQHLPNVGRESHTYLKHIVDNYERLSDWTVFTQAGEPSFGYNGHRSGGGHLLAGDDFTNYLVPHPSGSRFVYTAVVHLPSMNHLLRAAYCINDTLLEGGVSGSSCPKQASQWTLWWDMGDFRKYVNSKVESQHGEDIMDFYRKYINPSFTGDEVKAFFPQGARFAVSRATIQSRPKSDYEQLLISLSNNEDPYAGYFMEWLWSELFLGHQEPCAVPAKLAPVSHMEAMQSLMQRFPKPVERQSSTARSLAAVSGGISGGVSAGVSGGISGGISGGTSGDVSTTPIAVSKTTVAGVLEVDVDVRGEISKEVVEDMFKRAIAAAVGVPVASVVKLQALEITPESGNLRRLQTVQTKRYQVTYAVLVKTSIVDTVLEKTNRIAMPDTAESQLFRDTLTATDGVEEVRKIVAKTVPYKVDADVSTLAPNTPQNEDKDKNSWKPIVIGAVAILLGVSCLVTSAFLLKKKMTSTETKSQDMASI